MSQGKRWLFTINNYSPREYDCLLNIDQDKIKYLVVGKEIGELGTPHLQGYVVTCSNYRLSAIRKLINQRGHFEVARGSSAENRKYCTKEEDFFELGECPETDPGKREKIRWEEILQDAKKAKFDAIPADVFIRNYSNLRSIAKDFMERPEDATNVTGVWIHGVAGIGKSRYARYYYKDAYDKPINKWWDGYQQQPFVLIDDFGKDHSVLGHHLKRWADRYSFPAEIKGGGLQIRPEKIVVTSQYSIDDIWEDQETRDALKRRFEVVHLVECFQEPEVLATGEEGAVVVEDSSFINNTPCPKPKGGGKRNEMRLNLMNENYDQLINDLFY